ncbi:MAG: pitrilysin family protein [Rhodovibrionaceae bacterium]|nr:pitrilysin family protein [Rhodovibrionaceae bacterium]
MLLLTSFWAACAGTGHRRLRALGVFAAACLISVAAALPARAGVFNPETFTLDNGLQVVVVTNRTAPVVTHMVWYRVGAADEPLGKSGIAHFLEHLMFKGTEKLAPGEFSEIIARNGGRENAFTSQDYTGYYQTIARDRLELVMKHEADRMANLVLTDEVTLPELDVVLEERRSRVDNQPAARLSEMTQAATFLHHPYGIPVIGWQHEVSRLTTADALEFYETWYAPNNAILLVAGDVSAEEVRRLAETYYGPLEPAALPERKRVAEPEHQAPRRVVLEDPRVQQPQIGIRYLAPSYVRGESQHAYALEVLSQILGGGTTSRLYRNLVIQQAIAAGAGSWYGPDSLDLATFGFYVIPRPGQDPEAVEAALRAEIETLLADGVTAEELEKAKNQLRAGAVYARDSLTAAPRILGRALTTGQSVEDVEAWPERIEAVSREDVEAAARAVLREERSVTSILLPDPTS